MLYNTETEPKTGAHRKPKDPIQPAFWGPDVFNNILLQLQISPRPALYPETPKQRPVTCS